MTTTLTIDDDLAGILRQKVRELDRPFKAVVNTALRKGLADEMAESQQTVVVRPHDFGAGQAGFRPVVIASPKTLASDVKLSVRLNVVVSMP